MHRDALLRRPYSHRNALAGIFAFGTGGGTWADGGTPRPGRNALAGIFAFGTGFKFSEGREEKTDCRNALAGIFAFGTLNAGSLKPSLTPFLYRVISALSRNESIKISLFAPFARTGWLAREHPFAKSRPYPRWPEGVRENYTTHTTAGASTRGPTPHCSRRRAHPRHSR